MFSLQIKRISYTEEILKAYISDEELSRKMAIIPPANYKGCYKEDEIDFRSQWRIPQDACVMGYVGSVQPYKNIELIIDAAKKFPEIYFVVAGKARDPEYRKSLLRRTEGSSNIVTDFRFVEDNELPAFIKNCDFIITPYDKRSSLNSGVAILAFTYGRTVICPVIGTLLQMGDLDHVFSYNYSDDDEHQDKLNEAIQKAFEVFSRQPKKLAEINNWVRNYVDKNNSRQRVRESYLKLYNSVIRGWNNED